MIECGTPDMAASLRPMRKQGQGGRTASIGSPAARMGSATIGGWFPTGIGPESTQDFRARCRENEARFRPCRVSLHWPPFGDVRPKDSAFGRAACPKAVRPFYPAAAACLFGRATFDGVA